MNSYWTYYVKNKVYNKQGMPQISISTIVRVYNGHITGRGKVESWSDACGYALPRYVRYDKHVKAAFFSGDFS